MIRPPGFRAVAFETNPRGDARLDPEARRHVAAALGIASEWAHATQVHGADVAVADRPGSVGEADGIVTLLAGLPVVVATADCVPIAFEADGAVAVAHAGWRGVLAGVVEATIAAMTELGAPPRRAAVGPAIGPCCYEVGPEVLDAFAPHLGRTTWGTPSVDLPGAVAARLERAGIPTWRSPRCTRTDPELASWRGGDETRRQVTVAWR
ncbi:MAG TPA: laccase domain-containing protein [Actinobacteria bacterium]|nr:laccase domain-containing protein [Actinomycetota bacterium]